MLTHLWQLLAEVLKAVGRANYVESGNQSQRVDMLRAFCSVRVQLSVHTELAPMMIQEVVDYCEMQVSFPVLSLLSHAES